MESNDAVLVVGHDDADLPRVHGEARGGAGHDVASPPLLAEDLSLASVAATVERIRESLTGVSSMLVHLSRLAREPAGAVEHPAAAPEWADVVDAAVRTVPRWHFAMLNDHDRNDAFAMALERVVPRGASVLDIGSGTGLLAMMAAKAGAASVVTCEANPLLAEVARQIVALHGLSDVVTVLPKMSTQLQVGVDLPGRADVVVSEIVDCGLVGEGVLPTVRHAREHLLAPGGVLLPESARLMGALLQSQAVDGLNRVRSAGGFDVRLLNAVSTRGHFPVRLSTWPHRMLSEPVDIATFDFARDPLEDGDRDIAIPATSDGEAHALVAWFEMSLGGDVVVRNSPDNVSSHWMQACIPFREPVSVDAGRTVPVRVSWRGTRLSAQIL